jgi:hypothetical protein
VLAFTEVNDSWQTVLLHYNVIMQNSFVASMSDTYSAPISVVQNAGMIDVEWASTVAIVVIFQLKRSLP